MQYVGIKYHFYTVSSLAAVTDCTAEPAVLDGVCVITGQSGMLDSVSRET